MNYNELGDVQRLNELAAELSAVDSGAVSDTAQAAQELEQNNGIAFPYDPVLAQSVAMYAGIGSGIAARRWGEHWQLKEEEADAVSVATCQLIHHYFPDLEPTNPLWNFALVAGSVLGPRVLLSVMIKKQNEKIAGGHDESAN